MLPQEEVSVRIIGLLEGRIGLNGDEVKGSPDASLSAIGLDSLAAVEFSVVMAEEFGVDILDKELQAATLSELTARVRIELAPH